MPSEYPLIAVDIGNSRIKFGVFRSDARRFPSPAHVLEQPAGELDPGSLENWIKEANPSNSKLDWWIASVNRPVTAKLVAWLRERYVAERKSHDARSGAHSRPSFRVLAHSDLQLVVKLPEPERVGIDRLAGAVAANCLRAADRPAVIIDLGSAITIDAVDERGAFLGGAILPGIGMSVRAMHQFTDLLPQVRMEELTDPPPALGDSTIAAMRSGVYWGAIGGMKELLARIAAELTTAAKSSQGDSHQQPQEACDVFLTGGAAPGVAEFIGARVTWVPHLVLGGIALAARS
jgi:type III pantothenate kinase